MKWLVVAIFTVAAGCRSSKDDGAHKRPMHTSPVPIAEPVLGVDAVTQFNFVYDAGATHYKKAINAYKATPRNWGAIAGHCEAALRADPRHLEAQRLLASAYAQSDRHAEAAVHLLAALAADWQRYHEFAADPDLAAFLKTEHGASITDVSKKMAASFKAKVAAGIWLLARRSAFKMPRKSGEQWSSSRGEVYAYDLETKRYLRLTHTDHQVAAFVRNNSTLGLLLFDKVMIPVPPKTDGTAAPPTPAVPTFARAWLRLVNADTLAPIGKKTALSLSAAPDQTTTATAPGYALGLGVAANGTWQVGVAPAASELQAAPMQWTAIDVATGALAPNAAVDRALATYVAVSLDDAASYQAAPAAMVARLGAARNVDTASVVASSRYVAYATTFAPCDAKSMPGLYVVDENSAPHHVLTAASAFVAKWQDAQTLVYEDGNAKLRVWHATDQREVATLSNPAGLAVAALGASQARCATSLPSTNEPDSGDIDPEAIEIEAAP